VGRVQRVTLGIHSVFNVLRWHLVIGTLLLVDDVDILLFPHDSENDSAEAVDCLP
jgi:hypothetical protein